MKYPLAFLFIAAAVILMASDSEAMWDGLLKPFGKSSTKEKYVERALEKSTGGPFRNWMAEKGYIDSAQVSQNKVNEEIRTWSEESARTALENFQRDSKTPKVLGNGEKA